MHRHEKRQPKFDVLNANVQRIYFESKHAGCVTQRAYGNFLSEMKENFDFKDGNMPSIDLICISASARINQRIRFAYCASVPYKCQGGLRSIYLQTELRFDRIIILISTIRRTGPVQRVVNQIINYKIQLISSGFFLKVNRQLIHAIFFRFSVNSNWNCFW